MFYYYNTKRVKKIQGFSKNNFDEKENYLLLAFPLKGLR